MKRGKVPRACACYDKDSVLRRDLPRGGAAGAPTSAAGQRESSPPPDGGSK